MRKSDERSWDVPENETGKKGGFAMRGVGRKELFWLVMLLIVVGLLVVSGQLTLMLHFVGTL